MMHKISLILLFLIGLNTQAQNITGQWITIDDKTKEKKSIIEIYQQEDQYFGKIIQILNPLKKNKVCSDCTGDKKNKPILGMVILENLKKDTNEFNEGTILDPNNGKTYSCYVKLENQNTLKVRGYIGISLLGRTQYWQKVK